MIISLEEESSTTTLFHCNPFTLHSSTSSLLPVSSFPLWKTFSAGYLLHITMASRPWSSSTTASSIPVPPKSWFSQHDPPHSCTNALFWQNLGPVTGHCKKPPKSLKLTIGWQPPSGSHLEKIINRMSMSSGCYFCKWQPDDMLIRFTFYKC